MVRRHGQPGRPPRGGFAGGGGDPLVEGGGCREEVGGRLEEVGGGGGFWGRGGRGRVALHYHVGAVSRSGEQYMLLRIKLN